MNKEEKNKNSGKHHYETFSSLEFSKLYLIAEAKKKLGATPQGMWDAGSLTRMEPVMPWEVQP